MHALSTKENVTSAVVIFPRPHLEVMKHVSDHIIRIYPLRFAVTTQAEFYEHNYNKYCKA